jgi:hypothetical protein
MTPRTACTAIGKVLRDHLGGEYLPAEDIIDSKGFFRVQKKHCRLKDLLDNKLLSLEEASSLLKFTTIRNPFDSLVSLYVKKKDKYYPLLSDPESWVYRVPNYVEDMKFCKHHSFNAWIYKSYGRHLIKFVLGRGRTNFYGKFTQGVNEIMRFENLQKDFERILDRAGVKKRLTIPKINITANRQGDYHRYYSNLSRMMVEFILQNYLRQYGYRF